VVESYINEGPPRRGPQVPDRVPGRQPQTTARPCTCWPAWRRAAATGRWPPTRRSPACTPRVFARYKEARSSWTRTAARPRPASSSRFPDRAEGYKMQGILQYRSRATRGRAVLPAGPEDPSRPGGLLLPGLS
jgi:hypothetical protein